MIEGLAITPPVLGRISIGKVVERNGKRLPEKDDEFTVTSLVQGKDGWVHHPLDAALRKASADKKLRALPVKVLFADPDLSLRAEYTAFNRQTGRPVCAGNGQSCKRRTAEGLVTLPCPTPECHGSAYTGHFRVGVIRPAEAGGGAGRSRHIPTSVESAYIGHGGVGISRPVRSRHIPASRGP